MGTRVKVLHKPIKKRPKPKQESITACLGDHTIRKMWLKPVRIKAIELSLYASIFEMLVRNIKSDAVR